MARKRGMVVAKEAIVINVGAKPTQYRQIEVTDRRTGDRVVIPDTDGPPAVEEDPGVPYAFKANEKVAADHPAVRANPGAFMSLEEAEELDLVA